MQVLWIMDDSEHNECASQNCLSFIFIAVSSIKFSFVVYFAYAADCSLVVSLAELSTAATLCVH